MVRLAALLILLAAPALAQDRTQTLADIRQELSVLYVEVQRLKRELSTTGAPQVDVSGSTVLDRVAAMEDELRRLTAQTETLENRVNRVVADGTNRIGDLEFRLVELEGGDLSQLGETTTLGGGVTEPAAPVATEPAQTEMAVGEEADYQTALVALADGDFEKAARLFGDFNQLYPGSPLAAQAEFNRGKALDGLGDTREAARAYLASFSANTSGPMAADALFELGVSLGKLGQVEQACITLGEVGARFPGSPAAGLAEGEKTRLGCS